MRILRYLVIWNTLVHSSYEKIWVVLTIDGLSYYLMNLMTTFHIFHFGGLVKERNGWSDKKVMDLTLFQ